MISQVLTDTLTVNTLYELNIEVGNPKNVTYGGYNIELWAGDMLLAQDNNSLGKPSSGDFKTASIQYTALSGNSALGQSLEIKLRTATTGETNFDNVRLSAVSSVPVPAAAWLFGSALFGLIAVARRKS